MGISQCLAVDLHDGDVDLVDLEDLFRRPVLSGAPEVGARVPADVSDVSDVELVEGLGAWQRSVGSVTARVYGQVAELYARRVGPSLQRLAVARVAGGRRDVYLARQDVDLDTGGVEDEIALELSWSRSRASRTLMIALTLTSRMTRTLDALAAGVLEVRKAETMATDIGTTLTDDDLVARVEAVVLEAAQELTIPALRERIRETILRVAPEVAAERAAKARAGRAVSFFPAPDDMIRLEALLGADQGVAMMTALDTVASLAATTGDPRTAGQVRVDALVDALVDAVVQAADGTTTFTATGDSPGQEQARRARIRRGLKHEINVTVPLETITGAAEHPGYLARYGPITAGLARTMALDAAREGYWRCVVTDDTHGTLLGMGKSMFSPAYQAPVTLQRYVNLRDRVCDFPGVRREALVDRVEVRDLRRRACRSRSV